MLLQNDCEAGLLSFDDVRPVAIHQWLNKNGPTQGIEKFIALVWEGTRYRALQLCRGRPYSTTEDHSRSSASLVMQGCKNSHFGTLICAVAPNRNLPHGFFVPHLLVESRNAPHRTFVARGTILVVASVCMCSKFQDSLSCLNKFHQSSKTTSSSIQFNQTLLYKMLMNVLSRHFAPNPTPLLHNPSSSTHPLHNTPSEGGLLEQFD